VPVELEFHCPECGEDAPLGAAAGPLRARACARCGGALLGPADADAFRSRAGTPVSPPARPLPPLRCPSCAGALSRGQVGETPFAPCGACGAAWVTGGPMLGWIEERMGQPRATQAGPPGRRAVRSRRGLVTGLAGAAALAAVALVATFALRPRAPDRPAVPAVTPPAPAAPAAAAPSAAPAAEAVPAAPAPPAEAGVIPAPDATSVPFAPAQPEVEEVATAAGQPRLVLARRAGRQAALVVSFAAGSLDDGNLVGLTRVAQHALLAANARLDLGRLAIDLHAAGATLDLRTTQRDASFVLVADRRDFGALSARLVEALLAPRLAPERMPAAVARARLDGAEEPDLLQLVAMLAAEDTRYINPVVGRRTDIEAVTAEDVAEHLAGPLSPAAATVVAAGSFDRDELVRLVRRFKGGRTPAASRPQLAMPFAARRKSARELNLVAHPLTIASPRDAAAARLTARLLDDVLWKRFRGVGVGYSHSAGAYRTRWMDMLVVAVPARDASSDLGAALRAAVHDVRDGTFSDADLLRARRAVRGELRAVDGDPAALAETLATAGPIWHGKRIAAEVETLPREALTTALRGWLDDATSISLYVGPNP